MFKNHVYGIDLGSNMIKIYSQNSNEILKEKNMILHQPLLMMWRE